MIFDTIRSLSDTLIFKQRPPCKECLEAERGEHLMESTRVYDATQCVYVDAWRCPECDRAVYRGEDPTMVTPDGDRI